MRAPSETVGAERRVGNEGGAEKDGPDEACDNLLVEVFAKRSYQKVTDIEFPGRPSIVWHLEYCSENSGLVNRVRY